MSDTWLTAKIFVNGWEDKKEVIKRLIAPIVRDIDKKPWFGTFHFLSYGNEQEGIYLRFRVNLDVEKKEFLQESIERKKEYVNATLPLIKSIDYSEQFVENPEILKDEQKIFGEIGWEIFLNYFDYISRIVIKLLERPEAEMKAHPIKYDMTLALFHFLLNPLLYPSFDGDGETSAHLAAIQERYRAIVSTLMSQGVPKELALQQIVGSTTLMDKEWGFKLTLIRERI